MSTEQRIAAQLRETLARVKSGESMASIVKTGPQPSAGPGPLVPTKADLLGCAMTIVVDVLEAREVDIEEADSIARDVVQALHLAGLL